MVNEFSQSRILLVEDEEAHSTLIRRAFRKMAPQIVLDVVADLEGCRYFLSKQKVDLIITDLNLPDGKGTDIIRVGEDEIRPVVVMTSFGDEQEAVRALKAGALDYVVKSEYSLADMPHLALRALREYRQFLEGKKTAEQLRKLSHAVEQSSSCLLITDLQGRIEYVNPRFELISGYSLQELEGKNPRILRSPLAEPMEYDQIWSKILQGKSWRGIFLNRRKNGEDYHDDTTITPIRNENGEITHFLAIKEDISEQLRAKEEFSRMENQLRSSQKMQTIGTLAGGIAHDFNNILTPIFGFTNMAIESLPENHISRQDLEHVLRAAERARDLVRQILTFARHSDTDRQSVQLHHVIKEVLRLVRSTLPTSIEIKTYISTATKPVLADPSQIHQVVMNLCTNAAHAMREVGGLLEVQLRMSNLDGDFCRRHASMTPGECVLLSVRDNGCGMRSEVLDRIFEPFFTTKAVGEGTGLGMSVVHGIVTGHRGVVEIESQEGLGTKVMIYLPVAPLNTFPLTADKKESPLRGNGEHLLLVDDETEIIAMEKQVLGMLGYKVSAYTNSIEAWKAFSANPGDFDLLITDQTMPHLLGIQLAQKVLQMCPDFPIILLSGYSDSVTTDSAQQSGVREFLSKPLALVELSRVIRRVLDQAEPEGGK